MTSDHPSFIVEIERPAFHAALVAFLQETNPELVTGDVGEDDNLVDLGVIDSLRMVELIVAVEQILGVEIPVEDLDPRAFHSVRALYDTFGPPSRS